MREHPLLMQGPLVRATLEGRKTQTRTPVKKQPPIGYDRVRVCARYAEFENDTPPLGKFSTKSPMGEAGDRLWVRETHIRYPACPETGRREETIYQADGGHPDGYRWTPSIHMPRRVCRLVLPLVSVRVERVQDITQDDARAEGVDLIGGRTYRDGFRDVWQDIYGTWDANPWVWVAEWKEIEVIR